MSAGGRRERARWRVGFFVEVDVDASDQSEAVAVADAACRWPGDWRPPAEPTVHEGVIGRQTVTARVMRSRVLMAKEVTP